MGRVNSMREIQTFNSDTVKGACKQPEKYSICNSDMTMGHVNDLRGVQNLQQWYDYGTCKQPEKDYGACKQRNRGLVTFWNSDMIMGVANNLREIQTCNNDSSTGRVNNLRETQTCNSDTVKGACKQPEKDSLQQWYDYEACKQLERCSKHTTVIWLWDM